MADDESLDVDDGKVSRCRVAFCWGDALALSEGPSATLWRVRVMLDIASWKFYQAG